MKFKGTKGKWDYCENWSDKKIEIGTAENEKIALVSKKYKEAKYNAKLISCAPEMLQMLKDILDCNNRGFYEHINFNEIENLIKKATE